METTITTYQILLFVAALAIIILVIWHHEVKQDMRIKHTSELRKERINAISDTQDVYFNTNATGASLSWEELSCIASRVNGILREWPRNRIRPNDNDVINAINRQLQEAFGIQTKRSSHEIPKAKPACTPRAQKAHKHTDDNFLHRHVGLEIELDVPDGYVIVDLEDWKAIRIDLEQKAVTEKIESSLRDSEPTLSDKVIAGLNAALNAVLDVSKEVKTWQEHMARLNKTIEGLKRSETLVTGDESKQNPYNRILSVNKEVELYAYALADALNALDNSDSRMAAARIRKSVENTCIMNMLAPRIDTQEMK